MTRAYIYMQPPGETALVTLGRLEVKDGVGGVRPMANSEVTGGGTLQSSEGQKPCIRTF